MERREIAWKAVSVAAGAVAAAAARRAAVTAWEKARHEPAPTGPATRERSWPEALVFAVAVATGVAMARVVAERTAAVAWERATGSSPPSPS
jgi:Protein of unknown function (DUF4235)